MVRASSSLRFLPAPTSLRFCSPFFCCWILFPSTAGSRALPCVSALITLITVLPGVLADCVLVLDIEGDSEEFEVDRASGTGVTEVEHRGSSLGLVKGVTGDANNIPFSCAPPWTA